MYILIIKQCSPDVYFALLQAPFHLKLLLSFYVFKIFTFFGGPAGEPGWY